MSKTVGDVIVAAIVLIVGLGVLTALPVDVPDTGLHTLRDMGSAAFFPMLAALLVAASGVGLGLSAILRRNRADTDPVAATGVRPFAMIAGFIAFIPLIHLMGMITASAVMVLVLPLVFGFRDFRWLVPLAVVLPLCVYFLFERVLKVLFPHGALF